MQMQSDIFAQTSSSTINIANSQTTTHRPVTKKHNWSVKRKNKGIINSLMRIEKQKIKDRKK
jgi:hypothetical protein